MSSGGEFYYPDGRTKFSYTDYAGAFVGSFSTGGAASGSFTDARLIGKALVIYASSTADGYGGPVVTLDAASGLVTWSFTKAGNGAAIPIPTTTVAYGGY